MWVGTMGGLNLFDPVKKHFRRFYTKKDDVRGIAFILSIVSCKNGDLFFGGQGGLSIFFRKIGKLIRGFVKAA